jgi:hypothetical protein
MVAMMDLKSIPDRGAGSSPAPGTKCACGEMVDTLVLGTSLKRVGVRVPPCAPNNK